MSTLTELKGNVKLSSDTGTSTIIGNPGTTTSLGILHVAQPGNTALIGDTIQYAIQNPTLPAIASGNTTIRIGPINNPGIGNSSGLYAERSKHTIDFSGYRDAGYGERIGARIGVINKQVYDNISTRYAVQSADMFFSTYQRWSGTNTGQTTLEPTERMRITDLGYVGIGTTTPTCGLEVVTAALIRVGTNGFYFNTTNAANTTTSSTTATTIANPGDVQVAIRASGDEGRFLSKSGYFIESDGRIKINIVDVEDDAALVMFRKLKPKTYTYKDVISSGSVPVYGFIAQEVREVIPYSNVIRKDFVPNIYELATFLEDTITLTFNTSELSRDASGTLFPKLKVKTREGKDEVVNILEIIDDHTVRVDKDLTDWGGQLGGTLDASGQMIPGDKIFVFGQEVDDFHNLNKDAIWTVATAALQEVDRQLQAEKRKVLELENRITLETQKTTQMEFTLAAVLARLDALEQGSSPAEPVAQSTVEPAAEPVPEPAEPVTEPASEPAAEPASEPAEPVADPVVESSSEPVTDPV